MLPTHRARHEVGVQSVNDLIQTFQHYQAGRVKATPAKSERPRGLRLYLRRMIQAIFKDALRSDLATCPTYWAYIVAFRLSRPAELAGSDSSLPGIRHRRPRGFGSRSFRTAFNFKGCWFVDNLLSREIIILKSPRISKPKSRPLDNV